MAHNAEWLPTTRDGQLAMAREWVAAMTANAAAWGIPAQAIAEMERLAGDAGAALAEAQTEATRTPVATARCRAAFGALAAFMRDVKRRFFIAPPLTAADMVGLGLPPRDGKPTAIPPPVAQPVADISFPGIHLVELSHIGPAAAHSPDKKSDYGVRIHYGFTGKPTRAHAFRLGGRPQTGGELPYSAFTRRQKHRFDLDGESGNTMFLCLRYENAKGEPGPFGTIAQFVIP